MKTITLSEEAYERLAAHKVNFKDSFSQVVIRLVPKRGTLSDLAGALDQLPPINDEFIKAIEEGRRLDNDPHWNREPWTA